MTKDLKAKSMKCPECGKSCIYDISNPNRPFCSERCKTLDIAKWADETHKIPSEKVYPGDDDDYQQ